MSLKPCVLRGYFSASSDSFESEAKSKKVGRSPGSFFGAPEHKKNSENCVTVIIFQVLDTLKTNTKKEWKKVMRAIQAGPPVVP